MVDETIEQTEGNAELGQQMIADAINNWKQSKSSPEPEAEHEEDDVADTAKAEDKDDKGKFVKTEDPEVQKRINELWRKSKESEEDNQKLAKHSKDLEDALETVLQKLEKIESRQHKNDSQVAISRVRAQIKEAREMGDIDLEMQLEDQLLDLRDEERRLTQEKKKATAEKEQIKSEIRKEKESPPAYTDGESQYINSLAEEKDEEGNLLRPWLKAGDKNFKKATELGGMIAIELSRKYNSLAPLTEVMEELDKKMAKLTRQSEPEVLSGRNLQRAVNSDKVNLDKQQNFIYERLGLKSKYGIDQKTYAKRAQLIAKANSHSVSIEDFD